MLCGSCLFCFKSFILFWLAHPLSHPTSVKLTFLQFYFLARLLSCPVLLKDPSVSAKHFCRKASHIFLKALWLFCNSASGSLKQILWCLVIKTNYLFPSSKCWVFLENGIWISKNETADEAGEAFGWLPLLVLTCISKVTSFPGGLQLILWPLCLQYIIKHSSACIKFL